VTYVKRHSRLHEKILLSFFFQVLMGLIALWLVSLMVFAGLSHNIMTDLKAHNTLIATSLALVFSDLMLRKFLKYPGAQSVSYTIPTSFITYALMLAIFFFLRIDYSIVLISIGFVFNTVWGFGVYFMSNRFHISRYALVPFEEALQLASTNRAEFTVLKKPDLQGLRFNAVIADLRSRKLTAEWERFLANCTLHRIPVYHTKQVIESLTGRVRIDHLSENEFGALLPSEMYEGIKRLLDFLGVILLIPFLTPFLLAIAIWIKIDSKGPVFFIQERMGFRAATFRMYKFRSMFTEKTGTAFTQEKHDPRITRAGGFLRRYRLDELPQLFNILLGHMSFIGPRPESIQLTKSYSKEVPFFAYRHVVRPGISGWAQVNQGYAAEIDGMMEKLEYDFYYIKHFSFWLDILIAFKTIKTILTGFGSR